MSQPLLKRQKQDVTVDTVLQTEEIQLNEGDGIVVCGKGWLVVLQGVVQLHGYRVQGVRDGSVRIPLLCDATNPIFIESCGGLDGSFALVAARYALIRLESVGTIESVAIDGEVVHQEEAVLRYSRDVAGFDAFYPPEWVDSIRHLMEGIGQVHCQDIPVIAVCGGKNTGKSSLCRYIVNSLLSSYKKIDYMDIDCGQTEYSPPGLVSCYTLSEPMLGPPHLQGFKRPNLSHFIGSTSVSSDPDFYVQCVLSLYGSFQRRSASETSTRPLIINTNGWIQGLGFDVLCSCLHAIRVTHLIRLNGDSNRQNLPHGVFWKRQSDANVLEYVLPAISSSAPGTIAARELRNTFARIFKIAQQTYNAADKRNLMWNKFAAMCCSSYSAHQGQEWFSTIGDRLASEKPYAVSLDSLTITSTYGHIPESEMFRVLNGSIVGLCASSLSKEKTPLKCLGMGIIRSVNIATRTLYILTPEPEDILSLVQHLVVGKIDLPTSLLQTQRFKSPYLALHALSAEGTAAGSGKSRNNLQRNRHGK